MQWVTHHRTGWVLDCLRHPTEAHLVLHRATCAAIKRPASKRTHWTTGKHQKICSLDAEQLQAWAQDQTGHRPADCPECLPQNQVSAETHLTRLDRDILEIVLEVASIHIDEDDGEYRLTIGKAARCLGKTEGQLMPSVARLVADEMLILVGGAPALNFPRRARCSGRLPRPCAPSPITLP